MKANYLEFFNGIGATIGGNNAVGVFNDYQYNIWINPDEQDKSMQVHIFFGCYLKKRNIELEQLIITNSPLNVKAISFVNGIAIMVKDYFLDDIIIELKKMLECYTEALKHYEIPTKEYCPYCGKRIEHFDEVSSEALEKRPVDNLCMNVCNACFENTASVQVKPFKTYLLCILASFAISLLAVLIYTINAIPAVFENYSSLISIISWLVIYFNTKIFFFVYRKRRRDYNIKPLIVNYASATIFLVLYVLIGNMLVFGSMADYYGFCFNNYFEAFTYFMQNLDDVRKEVFSSLSIFVFVYIFDFAIVLSKIIRYNKKMKKIR